MGMTGYYFRADEDMMKNIREQSVSDVVFDENNSKYLLDIDKTWHAIHYTLTGTQYEIEDDEDVSHLILGGVPVSEEDMGYGPARLFTKEQVVLLNNALKEWDETCFRQNFNMEGMFEEEIYPLIEGQDEEEEFFSYVWPYFKWIKEFFQEAAKEEQYVLTFLA